MVRSSHVLLSLSVKVIHVRNTQLVMYHFSVTLLNAAAGHQIYFSMFLKYSLKTVDITTFMTTTNPRMIHFQGNATQQGVTVCLGTILFSCILSQPVSLLMFSSPDHS